MLYAVRGKLEELHLHENAMEKEDFEILIPVLTKIPLLKILNLNINRITGTYLRQLLDAYISDA